MSVGKCTKCGKTTNSTYSNWFFLKRKAEGCYASFDESTRTWSKGCCYDDGTSIDKKMVDKLIIEQPHKNIKPYVPIEEDFGD